MELNRMVRSITTSPRMSLLLHLHGVEHLVAILSLVWVRETDDTNLSVTFILGVHIT